MLKDIEVLREDSGKPFINLKGDMPKLLKQRGIIKLHVSISHCKEYATSQVIAEG